MAQGQPRLDTRRKEESDWKKMAHILIVDDEPSIRDLLRLSLEAADHEVLQAESGAEAVRILNESTHSIDLVVTDILMPDGDGIELISNLRKRENPPPVVAITGGGMMLDCSSLSTAKSLGASAIMAKPFSCVELQKTVQDLLE